VPNHTGPSELFTGNVLILAPHMDDEVLGCGGSVALLPDKDRVFVAYATDGRMLPGMIDPGQTTVNGRDLGAVRVEETKAALGVLGVPPGNASFLGFPVGTVSSHEREVVAAVRRLIDEIKPDQILVPFRFDQHPDHVALNKACRAAHQESGSKAQWYEYFIYFRMKLLHGGDIRQCIHPEHLSRFDITSVSDTKRKALECFTSQVTVFFPGQKGPVFSPTMVDSFVAGPEMFLKWPAALHEKQIFTVSPAWIRIVHCIEPILKWNKDKLLMALGRK